MIRHLSPPPSKSKADRPPRGVLTTLLWIELARRVCRHTSEYSCVGGKRERNVRQVVHPHFRSNGYRRHLDDLNCPFANNVAAQHPAGRAIDDQIAEAHLAPQ